MVVTTELVQIYIALTYDIVAFHASLIVLNCARNVLGITSKGIVVSTSSKLHGGHV